MKLFKFLESVFDLPSPLPPHLLEVILSLFFGSMLLWILFAAHYLVLQGGGKLLGFHVAAMQVCARSFRVLQGFWVGNEPPPPQKTYGTLALLAGSNLKGLMPLVLMSAFKTLYGGQFTSPTQLIKLNYPVILSN